MIIFLYGSDSYHRRIKLKEIIGQYQKKHSNLAWQKFDLEDEEDWIKLKDFLTAQSLFDESKIAVVSNLLSVAQDKELKTFLRSQLESKNFYLLISTSDKPNQEFNFLLKKPVVSQAFKLLSGADWNKFVDRELKKRNLIPTADIRSLIAGLEGDCIGLINELDKLSLLENCELRITDSNLSFNFFDSIQKIARGDFKTKLSNLEILLKYDDPAKIFNVLAYSVSPDQQIKMADYDVAIKSGKMDYPEALLDFMFV